ncbi:MAG: alpha/beta hydrolase [Rhizobiales bacterium 65-9]|nr:alpha/beta hydrolase [Hyphomicrobiales bacterium]OJY37302.1 MAG: alpha/beta hydrolase [Rhizobiales bacterium 65-9]
MEPQLSIIEAGPQRRRIATLRRDGGGPCVVWLGGFRSDMRATKAEALDRWAAGAGRALLRFDYSGHGESGGDFADGTIGAWSEDALAAIEAFAGERPVFVGSSMGGWIALLIALELKRRRSPQAPSGLVLIAPAVDFTEALMWPQLPEEARRAIETRGVWLRPSDYSPEPYPITRRLFEEGRKHLLLDAPIEPGCPVHILQGMRDPDVPWRHALTIVEHLPADAVTLSLVKDGDHRLSREQDVAMLIRAVAAMVENL